jgi:hypothetical protein
MCDQQEKLRHAPLDAMGFFLRTSPRTGGGKRICAVIFQNIRQENFKKGYRNSETEPIMIYGRWNPQFVKRVDGSVIVSRGGLKGCEAGVKVEVVLFE